MHIIAVFIDVVVVVVVVVFIVVVDEVISRLPTN